MRNSRKNMRSIQRVSERLQANPWADWDRRRNLHAQEESTENSYWDETREVREIPAGEGRQASSRWGQSVVGGEQRESRWQRMNVMLCYVRRTALRCQRSVFVYETTSRGPRVQCVCILSTPVRLRGSGDPAPWRWRRACACVAPASTFPGAMTGNHVNRTN